MERALQDGVQRCQPTDIDNYCRVQLRLFAEGRNDDDVQTYARSIAAPSVEHANTIVALRNRAGPNAYYIDLSSVNATPPSAFAWKTDLQEPLKSAEQRMASALRAMPMVAAVYRDIGNMYFRRYLMCGAPGWPGKWVRPLRAVRRKRASGVPLTALKCRHDSVIRSFIEFRSRWVALRRDLLEVLASV